MAEITYIEAIRQALWEEMERDERVFLIGEDMGAPSRSPWAFWRNLARIG